MENFAHIFKRLVAGALLAATFSGCGYKELPGLKEKAESSFRNMLIQYRLRADLVPHFIKLAEGTKTPGVLEVVKSVAEAQGRAVALDMPINQFDEKQMNRFQSFHFALDREVMKMLEAFDKDPKIAKNPEYGSLKAQLDRLSARVASAQQQFRVDGPAYNVRLAKTPEKWFNQIFYKFQPLPVLENSAAQ